MHDDNPSLDELNQQFSSPNRKEDKHVFRNSAFLSSIIQQYLLIDSAKHALLQEQNKQRTLSVPTMYQQVATQKESYSASQVNELICLFLQTSLEMLKKVCLVFVFSIKCIHFFIL